MEETRISGQGMRSSPDSAQATAEKVIRDAEARDGRASTAPDGALVRETTSSYLGMTRKEPVASVEAPIADNGREPNSSPSHDDAAPFSSALGIPTLMNTADRPSDDVQHDKIDSDGIESSRTETARSDTFISSGLGLPLLSDNPTPLSDALHIPTLIKSKPSPE